MLNLTVYTISINHYAYDSFSEYRPVLIVQFYTREVATFKSVSCALCCQTLHEVLEVSKGKLKGPYGLVCLNCCSLKRRADLKTLLSQACAAITACTIFRLKCIWDELQADIALAYGAQSMQVWSSQRHLMFASTTTISTRKHQYLQLKRTPFMVVCTLNRTANAIPSQMQVRSAGPSQDRLECI